MKRIATTSALALAFSLTAFGWGQKGHDVTANIAERHLTPVAAQAIAELLDGKSIVYWANWLDNSSNTPEYRYTKTWHYKNIDADQSYDSAPTLETGNVVTALNSQIPMLNDPSLSREERQLALKIVVHLMGDIHQPMHMGHASDLGGNRWSVKYFGSNANLHGTWDSKLPESAHKWSYNEWSDMIDRLSPEEVADIQKGSPDAWGRETFGIATLIYNGTPEDTNISYDYVFQWTPTIEDQFLKGGLRLADVLNQAFDPDYQGHSTLDQLIKLQNGAAKP